MMKMKPTALPGPAAVPGLAADGIAEHGSSSLLLDQSSSSRLLRHDPGICMRPPRCRLLSSAVV